MISQLVCNHNRLCSSGRTGQTRLFRVRFFRINNDALDIKTHLVGFQKTIPKPARNSIADKLFGE